MKKYKICPECHEKNDPSMIDCIACGTDLMNVKITDEEMAVIREIWLVVRII